MRSHLRTIIVLAVAVALIALFLHNVDLWRVLTAIMHAQPEWLALSIATMLVNLAIRALLSVGVGLEGLPRHRRALRRAAA